LEALVRKSGARLRRIEVESWHSEVATTHRVRKLPRLELYDGEKLVTADVGAVLARLRGQER
jgi:hypothetical protein